LVLGECLIGGRVWQRGLEPRRGIEGTVLTALERTEKKTKKKKMMMVMMMMREM
jgi:hypothetical protein